MKKIILSFACMVVAISVFAQHPIGNDSFNLQTVANSLGLFKSKGAIGSDSGFVNARYADTAAANLGNRLKNYPGALIRVGNSLWMRDSTAQQWLEMGAGGATTLQLQTNGVNNGSQILLNLQEGTNINLVDNGTGTVTISADTISSTHDTLTVTKKLRIPLTDTTNAKKGCGNIIYDTILEHYFGDVCVNGVHDKWGCFDCMATGTITEITATNNYAQTWTITNPNGPTTNLSLVLDTTLLSTRANVDSKTITLNQGTNVVITGNPTQNLGQNPSWTIAATTSGGSTNSNIGSGYRWAVPNTNNIKTMFAINGLALDSATNANALTLRWGTNPLIENTTITGAGFYTRFTGGRLQAGMGASIAAANDLTLGNDGNTFSITGATTINAVTTTNWQAGSVVNLVFASTPVVRHNIAGGAGTAVILLAGGIDFTAAANDVLTLLYDGTSWHETSRKVAGSGSGLFWPLGGTGTGYAATNINYNTVNWMTLGGHAVTTASLQWGNRFSRRDTLRATASDIYYVNNIIDTVSTSANSQFFVDLRIKTTRVGTGSGTGNASIMVNGNIIPDADNTANLGGTGAGPGSTSAIFTSGAFYSTITNAISTILNAGLTIQAGGTTKQTFFAASSGIKFNHNQSAADSGYMMNVIGEGKFEGGVVVAQLPTPTISSITNVGTPGGTTYKYKIVFKAKNGTVTAASAEATTTTGNATLSATNSNQVNWAITEAQREGVYQVDLYRTSGGATQGLIKSTSGNYTTASLTDQGDAGDGSTAPTINTSGAIGAGGVLRPHSVLQTTSFATGYTAQTGTYTATAVDQTIDCTSGTFTVTLPTAVGITGRIYTVVNSGAGTITIGTTSSQTFVNINAAPTTLTLGAVGAGAITSYTVRSNGANWIVTGKVKNE